MTREQVLSDIQSLIQDIDKCTGALCRARVNRELESLIMYYEKIEQLIVAAHQELTYLYDYIKEGGSNECI